MFSFIINLENIGMKFKEGMQPQWKLIVLKQYARFEKVASITSTS